MGIWLERLTSLLKVTPSPAVTARGSELGLPLVLSRMLESPGFGWIEADARLRDDPVLQGNALAAALNRASGTHMFHEGLPLDDQLQRLRHYSDALLPLRLAVTGIADSAGFANRLLQDLPDGVWLLLDYFDVSLIPAGLDPLPDGPFLLTAVEALQLAPAESDPGEVLRLLAQAAGLRPAFEELLTALEPAAGSSAAGGAAPAGTYPANLVVSALLRQNRLEDALELAVQAAPRLVEQIIRRAGPEFTRRGQLDRLHLLLSSLDEPWASLEATLEWRLVAGVAAADYRHLLPLVDAHLATHPAPDLRARRAGLMPREARQAMAAEALQLARTPLTLWQAGRMAPDPEAAITLLQEGVRLAEDTGSHFDVARNAGALAAAYLDHGDLRRSLHWAEWALSVLDEHDIADTDRRKRILNLLAFAAMLCGETAGLRSRLEDALTLGSAPGVNANIRLTLALLKLSEGDPAAAAALADQAVSGASRQLTAYNVHHRVLIMLAAGEQAAAGRLVEQALAFADGEFELLSSSGRLARGMLLALGGDAAAAPLLDEVLNEPSNQLDQRLMACLYRRLLPGPHRPLPENLKLPLSQLSRAGLRLLSAPAARFETVWQELLGADHELQLRTLGRAEATWQAQPLKLTRRMWEVLLVIALHPDGISDEQLHDFLVKDSGLFGLSALRTHVSRVRALLPVTDTPYRLETSYSLDLLELRNAIRSGNLRQALELARGPLLPGSDAPGIQDLRADAAAELEQAVFSSEDTEAVYSLAEQLGDDIRLWERARELLPASDARRVVAAARLQRLGEEYA